MTEAPRLSLDIGGPGSAGAGAAGADTGARRDADPALAEQFRRSLGEAAADGAASAPGLANPFALFGTLAAPAGAPAPQAPAAEARFAGLQEAIERILVSDGSTGGEREVRVRLSDDLLPGTELRIVQHEGRLEVAFVAVDPASLAWLVSQSESMARELARRLKRDVRVAVRDEEGDREGGDAATSDAGGEPPPPSGPASLFGGLAPRRDGGAS